MHTFTDNTKAWLAHINKDMMQQVLSHVEEGIKTARCISSDFENVDQGERQDAFKDAVALESIRQSLRTLVEYGATRGVIRKGDIA